MCRRNRGSSQLAFHFRGERARERETWVSLLHSDPAVVCNMYPVSSLLFFLSCPIFGSAFVFTIRKRERDRHRRRKKAPFSRENASHRRELPALHKKTRYKMLAHHHYRHHRRRNIYNEETVRRTPILDTIMTSPSMKYMKLTYVLYLLTPRQPFSRLLSPIPHFTPVLSFSRPAREGFDKGRIKKRYAFEVRAQCTADHQKEKMEIQKSNVSQCIPMMASFCKRREKQASSCLQEGRSRYADWGIHTTIKETQECFPVLLGPWPRGDD